MTRLLARLLPLCALLSASAPGADIEVQSQTLENGLKILIHEDHDIPSVALYLFFEVGSRNEGPGVTGISHYFEHMMFNGTERYGPKQFDIEMERAGGRNNAYTSRDVTVYTDWFPPSALELMFDMEADRMQHLSFDPKIVESERGVVYSERRMGVDNDPEGALAEQVDAAAYTAHPYGWPVVGWAADIEAWTMEDLERHYRMGYAPNNCVMVVAGDVTPERILDLAQKRFAPIPRQEPPPPVRTTEPKQEGERRVTLRKPAQLALVMASYHVPETKHADHAALEALSAVLASGRSSRLYRRLVEEDQLVLNVDAGQQLAIDPTQFGFRMRIRSGIDPARAEAALYEELQKLGDEGVTAAELDKARRQLLAAFYRDLKTIAGKADLIGRYEVFYGDHRKINDAVAALEQVTAEDVQRVAAQYFQPENRTVGVLIPEEESEGASE